jgi:hypothetical protein
MRRLFGLLAMGVVLSLGVSARADLVFTFFENGGTGDKGTPVNFNDTTSTYVLPTSVVTINGLAQQLHVKGSETLPPGTPGVEDGLGIVPDGQDEINPKGYVHFDFSGLKALFPHLNSLTFYFGSEQINEGTQLYADSTGSTTAMTPPPGKLIFSSGLSDAEQSKFTVLASDFASNNYYNVIAYGTGNSGNPNILVNEILLSTTTPEPSTLVIGSLGVLGFGAYSLRHRRAKKAQA